MNLNSRNRATRWAIENLDNNDLIGCLNNGIYGVKRDYGFNKNFRDGDVVEQKKRAELSHIKPKPMFFTKKMDNAKNRGLKMEKKMKELYLKKGKIYLFQS